jgi:hypothetical protein
MRKSQNKRTLSERNFGSFELIHHALLAMRCKPFMEVPMPGDRRQAPRLVVRLYTASNHALRVQLLNCLLRPLGLLGAVGAAAGAFSAFVLRRGDQDVMVRADELSQITTEQVLELARFVEQVNPDALRQVAQLVSHQHMGMATFTAAALVLLHRSLSQKKQATETHGNSSMETQGSAKDSQSIKSLM